MSARRLHQVSLLLASVTAASTAIVVTACSDDDAATSSTSQDAGTEAAVATDAAAGKSPDDAGALLPVPPPFDAGVDAGPIACGAASCKPADFRGLATLGACCNAGACGVELKNAAAFVPVADVCMPLVNPGAASAACATFPKPSELYAGDLQGCCRPNNTCGVFVQLSSTLDLGCVPADAFIVDAGDAAVGNPCDFDGGLDGGS